MKKARILTLLSLFLLFTIACNKEDASSFRIIDAATKEGIPNATVELHESTGGGIIGGSIAVFRERTMTNDLGEYQFDYDTKNSSRFLISAGADRYWNSTANIYQENKTLELDPEGYVRVKVMKVDTIEYAMININDGLVVSFAGQKIDTSFVSKQRGNLSHQYVWFIYNNIGESSNTRGEEFYVPPHDTTTFEIIF